MAAALPNIGKGARYGDLKRRLLFLLGALVVFRIGAHIPVPGIDPARLVELFSGQQGGILGMFNMFSGGALRRFTIFALGIMPYISASIIMQLMTAVSPQLDQLRKEGESGRRKLTQWTRFGTVGLSHTVDGGVDGSTGGGTVAVGVVVAVVLVSSGTSGTWRGSTLRSAFPVHFAAAMLPVAFGIRTAFLL